MEEITNEKEATPEKQSLENLVDSHADFVINSLTTSGVSAAIINAVDYHYKEAFAHGYKHAIEDAKK